MPGEFLLGFFCRKDTNMKKYALLSLIAIAFIAGGC